MPLITSPGELTVAGISAIGLTMAMTQKFKNHTSLNPELVSVVLGLALGALGWLYIEGVPGGMESAIAMAFYVLGMAFTPSGVYEVGEDMSGK